MNKRRIVAKIIRFYAFRYLKPFFGRGVALRFFRPWRMDTGIVRGGSGGYLFGIPCVLRVELQFLNFISWECDTKNSLRGLWWTYYSGSCERIYVWYNGFAAFEYQLRYWVAIFSMNFSAIIFKWLHQVKFQYYFHFTILDYELSTISIFFSEESGRCIID